MGNMNVFEREFKELLAVLKKVGSTDAAFSELGRLSGVHRSTIRKMVTGKVTNPTIGVLSKLYDALEEKNSISGPQPEQSDSAQAESSGSTHSMSNNNSPDKTHSPSDSSGATCPCVAADSFVGQPGEVG